MRKEPGPKVKAQLTRILESFSRIPMVSIKENTGTPPMEGCFSIEGHPPLDTVSWRFEKRNRLWTQDYHLFLKATVPETTSFSGTIELRTKGKAISLTLSGGMKEREIPARLKEAIAPNGILSVLWTKLDISECKLIYKDESLTVILSPYAASCVRMLFPPLAYAVTIREEEAVSLLQMMQVLLRCVK